MLLPCRCYQQDCGATGTEDLKIIQETSDAIEAELVQLQIEAELWRDDTKIKSLELKLSELQLAQERFYEELYYVQFDLEMNDPVCVDISLVSIGRTIGLIAEYFLSWCLLLLS